MTADKRKRLLNKRRVGQRGWDFTAITDRGVGSEHVTFQHV